MAENTTAAAPVAAPAKEKKELPKLTPFPVEYVTRKGDGDKEITIPLTTFQILKGKNFGTAYLAPEITIENLAERLAWIGAPNVVNILQVYCKRVFWSIWANAKNPDGSFNKVQFLKEAEDFTASAMKLSEIDNKIEELQNEQARLLDTVDVEAGMSPETLIKIKGLAAEIRGYKAMAENKRKKPEAEVDEPDQPATAVNA